MPPGPSFYQAADAILAALGLPADPVRLNLLVAWSWCEKPHPDGAWQWWNPLNTTQPAPGSYPVNAAGVQAYPDQATGVTATVQTLRNGYYPHLLAALGAGDAQAFLSARSEIETWGTDPDCIAQTYASLPAPPAWALTQAEQQASGLAPAISGGVAAGVVLLALFGLGILAFGLSEIEQAESA